KIKLTEYALIQEKKTWNEARDFCRKNYIDLATVQTDEEWSKLNELRANYRSNTWIGLYDDVNNSWKWSDQTSTSSALRWASGQPDNSFGRYSCAALDYDGQIVDESCSRLHYFLSIKCSFAMKSDV
uniref:C-type lectin domain-containing protein n=1 Tax=Cyprinus carpio carpio TaxID=630221 RepID=A0A9J8CDF5_CYPCA